MMDNIKEKILDLCKSFVASVTVGESRAMKTEKLKSALLKLGKDEGFAVYTGGVSEIGKEKDWTEWLWDLVWAEQKMIDETGEAMIVNLPLIAEIEWDTSYESILQDFEKLVFGIADYKLYIFSKPGSPEWISEFCKKLTEINNNKKFGKYILVGIPTVDQQEEIYIDFF